MDIAYIAKFCRSLTTLFKSVEQLEKDVKALQQSGNGGGTLDALNPQLLFGENGRFDINNNPDVNFIFNSQGGNVIAGGITQGHGITCGRFTDYHNEIDGGFLNVISGGGDNAIGGGGSANAIKSGAHNTIGYSAFQVWHSNINGGSCNKILGTMARVDYSSINTGTQNLIDSADLAFIGTGIRNKILGESAAGSAILNGRDHTIGTLASLFSVTDASVLGGLRAKVGVTGDADYGVAIGGVNTEVNHKRAVSIGGANVKSVMEGATHVENLYIESAQKFANDASATVPKGVIWQTSASNTLGLPAGVLMIKQ